MSVPGYHRDMLRRRALARLPSVRALAVAMTFSVIAASGLVPLQPARPVSAGTAESMESLLLSKINAARASRGLLQLRLDSRLVSVSGVRAATLASKGVLSHDAAGCLECQIDDAGVSWDLYGEVLASNSYPWGSQAASVIFESWRKSSSHWSILMNPTMDSIGIGVAHRDADGSTYASAVLVDIPGVSGIKAATTPKPTATRAPSTARAPTPTPTPTPEPIELPGPAIPGGRIAF